MIQVVVTPGSGDGRASAIAESLVEALHAGNRSVRLTQFDNAGRLARWSTTCASTFSHLVCVGGDATMSAAAPAAVRHRVPMVAVPSGFGNLFASTFGCSSDVASVLETIERGEVVYVDAGTCRGELFLSHESFGMLDDIQNSVEGPRQPRARALRFLAYYRAGLSFLARALPWSIRVEVDGVLVARRAALVTVANVKAYGDLLTLTPDASPMDGRLDVFVIPRTTRFGLWTRLFKLLLRLPQAPNDVLVRRGRRVTVQVRGRERQEIRVLPGALPLLVSADWRASHPEIALPAEQAAA